MQLDLDNKPDSEKQILLTPYSKVNMLVVVCCGRYMIKHFGKLAGFNADGSVMALSAPTDRKRIIYSEGDYEERDRNPNNPKDMYQYVPVKYVDKVILSDKIFVDS